MYSRHFNYNRDENKQKTNRQYGISAEKLNKNDRKNRARQNKGHTKYWNIMADCCTLYCKTKPVANYIHILYSYTRAHAPVTREYRMSCKGFGEMKQTWKKNRRDMQLKLNA